MKVTYKEIAKAASVSVSKVEGDKRKGAFDKGDLKSIAFYIMGIMRARISKPDEADLVQARASIARPEVAATIKELNAMYCDHANEVPQACPCAANCYCKSNTCAGESCEETHQRLGRGNARVAKALGASKVRKAFEWET